MGKDIFGELAKVAYGLNTPKAKAPQKDYVEDNESVLDEISLEERITDFKKPREVKKDTPKVKIINKIIDYNTIKDASKSSRKKEELLSTLNDEERRKVVKAIKQIKDDEQKINQLSNQLDLSLFNTLVQNYLFDPTEFNLLELQNFVEKTDLSDVFVEQDDFIEGLKNFDLSEDLIQSYKSLMEENNINTAEVLFEQLNSEKSEEVDIEEGSEEVDESIDADIKDAVNKKITTLDITAITDTITGLKSKYYQRGYNAKQVTDSIFKHVNEKIKTMSSLKLRDDVISQLEEIVPKDANGREIVPEEELSPLKQLEIAISEFIEGNPEKLNELAGKGDGNPEPTEDVIEEISEEPTDENSEEPTDDEIEEDDVLVTDCARHILNPKVKTNKIIDKLLSKVKILGKYNFKVSDCVFNSTNELEVSETVPEPPLTRNEFYSLYQEPIHLKLLLKGVKESIPVSSVEAENNVIITNKNHFPQYWVPITGSAEEVLLEANEGKGSIADVITEKCVPQEEYLSLAAKSNELAAIDNCFYKQRLSDICWCLDEIPEFLGNCDIKTPCVLKPYWADSVSSKKVNILGTDYYVE